MSERCFVCGRPLPRSTAVVYCADDQAPAVGIDCRSKVISAGVHGFDTSRGRHKGPRVWGFKEWTPSRIGAWLAAEGAARQQAGTHPAKPN